VKIDIPSVLVDLRAQVVDAHRGGRPDVQTVAMKASGVAFGDSRRLALGERVAGLTGRLLRGRTRTPGRWLPFASGWTRARDLPVPPRESVRAWWRRTDGGRK
jgi:L-lactate dehydrogenase complex protein LldF